MLSIKIHRLLLIVLCTISLNSFASGQNEEDTQQVSSGSETDSAPPAYVAYPTGGILMQYTTTGLNFIISMAEKASVKLMKDFPIPDTEGTGYSVTNAKVNSFDPPKYQAHFKNQSGIWINVTIPKLDVSTNYKVGYGFVGTSGSVKCKIEDLVITMLIRIPRGKSGHPSLDLPKCDASLKKFDMTFSDAGTTGTVMNMLRGVMEGVITSSISGVVCYATRETTAIIEAVFFDLEKPIPELLNPNKTGPAPAPDQMMNMTVICGPGQVQEPKKKDPNAPPSKVTNMMTNFVKAMDGLSVDMKMDHNAYFTDDDMVCGLRGDFLYKGTPSGYQPAAVKLPPTTRSMCFAVSDAMINAFCKHGQEHNYFKIDQDVSPDDLPPELRTPVKLFCPKCQLILHGHTMEQPSVKFTKASGVQAKAKMQISVDASGTLIKKSLFDAQVDMDIGVKLRIENNVVKGKVELKSTNIKLNKIGLSGRLDKPINDFINKLIPKVVWPVFERAFNKFMESNGVRLPAYCGMSFKNAQISYADGDVIVCTDLVYDIDGFLDRFTAFQKEQQAKKLVTTTAPPTTTGGGWWFK